MQRLYPNQLSQQLQRGFASCYLLFGDEPLQRVESVQLIQNSASQHGYDEVNRIPLEGAEVATLVDALQGMSLFAARQVVVLDAGSGKLDKQIAEILVQYARQPSPDILLVVHGEKLESAQKNKAWYKALQKIGVEVTISQPAGNALYRWLNDRCRTLGIQPHKEAMQLLAESHEGNLLALSQELEKLQLIYPNQVISLEQVRDVSVDQSRYSVFQLADALLTGDIHTTSHMLEQLRQEDAEPLILLWAINREISALQQLLQPQARGNEAALFKSLRIWPSRQNHYRTALSRLNQATLAESQLLLAELERQLKGGETTPLSPWLIFTMIGLKLCGHPAETEWLLPVVEAEA